MDRAAVLVMVLRIWLQHWLIRRSASLDQRVLPIPHAHPRHTRPIRILLSSVLHLTARVLWVVCLPCCLSPELPSHALHPLPCLCVPAVGRQPEVCGRGGWGLSRGRHRVGAGLPPHAATAATQERTAQGGWFKGHQSFAWGAAWQGIQPGVCGAGQAATFCLKGSLTLC